MSANTIDIIVPVYKGLSETRQCLESLYAARNERPWHLVLIDDKSPEPDLSDYVTAFAEEHGADLIRHPDNRGFAASVNEGMRLHVDRNVVLLNSDTEVHGDWLDRMVKCAESDGNIATVTAFSNNGAICSYPVFMSGWDEANLPDLAQLDEIFRAENSGRVEEIPTGVGYCMFIKRKALTSLGDFDVAHFGAGYGEENEFCARAAREGWRNVLACDVFVLHKGGVSFGDASELQAQATRKLDEVAPEFAPLAQRFIADDPIRVVRRRIDEARAARGGGELRRVLDERDFDIVRRTQVLGNELAESRRLVEELRHVTEERVNGVIAHAREDMRQQEQLWQANMRHVQEDMRQQEQLWQANIQQAFDSLARMESALEAAKVDLAGARAELNSVYNSRSWRYTRFLRRQ